ncbi:hypothetical protein UVI_02049910 [Ustilaginoidea virens]|nr:hypothetical protein UVI_02049910 [Ustilaginoidea virens]
MAKGSSLSSPSRVILFALLGAFIYKAELPRVTRLLGIWRENRSTVIANANDLHVFPDTIYCEDIHHHEPSGLLFTACEATESLRYSWFPGLSHLNDPVAASESQGTIDVIDPQSMTAKKLKFTNFDGAFITHGIDVIDDPDQEKGKAVYIFAVNHVPSAAYVENENTKEPKARSRIEVFHHVIGSDTARHVRSVWDPLITTPNDILAVSPTAFFVTNDHYYREGLMRLVEDIFFGAKWTNTIYVEFSNSADGASRNGRGAVNASVAISGVHNNNGLGHGPTPDQALVVSCVSGRLRVGDISAPKDGKGPKTISLRETLEFDSLVDNPSWFRDPYAKPGQDFSGIVVPGLTSAASLLKTHNDPNGQDGSVVWMVNRIGGKWQKRVLFEDDSRRLRAASAAVLVAIDPKQEQGKRKAWLFVTGFLSKNTIAVKIDL